MIKFLKITFLSFFIATSAVAGSDGELELSKKNNSTKDCFEPLNRATFALNQGLDKAILKPVAKGYRSLPSPIKKGTGNVLNNLSAQSLFKNLYFFNIPTISCSLSSNLKPPPGKCFVAVHSFLFKFNNAVILETAFSASFRYVVIFPP